MRYFNFDIWVDEKQGGSYPVRASADRLGEVRGQLRMDLEQAELQRGLQRLGLRETSRELMVALGTDLYERLFTGDVGGLFHKSFGFALAHQNQGIRLRLRIQPSEIAALPWELVFHPTEACFLGTLARCPVVRYVELAQPIRALETELPLRMLVAIPETSPPFPDLDVQAEKANLLEALSGLQDWVEVHFLEGRVSCTRISDALLEREFHCFHFIGHGLFEREKGFLLLNAEDGGLQPVDDEQFAGHFRNHRSMKLVVLNSCKGAQVSSSKPLVGMGPNLVMSGIPAVVAMQFSIQDRAAVLFAREFYRSLFRGVNQGRVEVAMGHARNRLASEFINERDMATPVLFMRAWEGVLFTTPPGPRMADLLFSAQELDTKHAAVDTYRRSIALLESEDEASAAKRELARLKGRIRFRNGLIVTAFGAAMAMFFASWVSLFDLLHLDTRMESLTLWLGDMFVTKQFSEHIIIVPITPATVSAIGGPFGPSWRRHHAKLVDRLAGAGAKVIAFDMYFHRESETHDEALADAIRSATESGTTTVLGVVELEDGKPRLLEALARSTEHVGAACIGEKLGLARTAPLAVIQNGPQKKAIRSLALEAVMAYGGLMEIDQLDRDLSRLEIEVRGPKNSSRHVRFSELTEAQRLQRDCPLIREGDRVADLLIDLTPLPVIRDSKHTYAYERIVLGAAGDAALRTTFEDKLVVVGLIKEEEVFETFGQPGADRFGFELHADAMNSILQDRAIRSAGPFWQLAIMALLGVLGAFIRFWAPPARPGLRKVLLVTLSALYLLAALQLYAQHRLLLNIVYHIGALYLAYAIAGKVEVRLLSSRAWGRS